MPISGVKDTEPAMCGLRVTQNVHLILKDPSTSSLTWSVVTGIVLALSSPDLGKPGSSGTLSHYLAQCPYHNRSQREELLVVVLMPP